ncbi:MAG: hypothetical protein IT238_08475 [Bacteroidia bacterium]|nr:hypothetical protein [Bacteroidia bacterium]MCZ2248625.1 hypothetical protein [Bacteroidia bacterium]
MSKERFINLVKNPAELQPADIPFLEELLHEFPYFQVAHLLAARAYKAHNSIHTDKQIRTAAAHITNRTVLFNLIEKFDEKYGKEISLVPKPVEETIITHKTEPQPIENIIAEKENKDNNPSPIENSDVSLENDSASKEGAVIDDKAPEVDIVVEEKLVSSTESQPDNISELEMEKENIVEKSYLPDKESLELNIIEVPLEKEIQLAITESLYQKEFEEKSEDNTTTSEDINHTVSEETSYQEPEENTHTVETEESSNFVKWLKSLQKESADESKNTQETNEFKENPTNLDNKKEQEKKILDAFVEKMPQMKKPNKQEFYNPVNMAKQSVADNDLFVTETLAKIYIKQGNLAKAIKIYENLSLKNPKNNSTFATQIKILKEQLHNKTTK